MFLLLTFMHLFVEPVMRVKLLLPGLRLLEYKVIICDVVTGNPIVIVVIATTVRVDRSINTWASFYLTLPRRFLLKS